MSASVSTPQTHQLLSCDRVTFTLLLWVPFTACPVSLTWVKKLNRWFNFYWSIFNTSICTSVASVKHYQTIRSSNYYGLHLSSHFLSSFALSPSQFLHKRLPQLSLFLTVYPMTASPGCAKLLQTTPITQLDALAKCPNQVLQIYLKIRDNLDRLIQKSSPLRIDRRK